MRPCVPFPRHVLVPLLAIALAGCGTEAETPQAASGAAVGQAEAEPRGRQPIDALAGSLQACSYDGSTLRVDPQGMAGATPGAGAQVVSEIMRFTGLPQNFEVLPHPKVPNAAALIVLGPDRLPRRVIAYNEAFMASVREATANNDWAPISIMAHEIGHHLSGHTIQPGGSQPPTELEADKFSGFVLYRMGAALADAQKAMSTLVPEQDGPTHPGRSKRVRAIAEGWQQACSQQGSACQDTLAAAPPPPRSTPSEVPAPTVPSAGDAGRRPSAVPATATAATGGAFPGLGRPARDAPSTPPARGAVDVLPVPDAQAIPAKFGKFVVDELGVLDPATRAAFEQRMFTLASQHAVEIVTLLVDSLHGLDADAYAGAMLRQLRVGKLDVGNGAVLVAAPHEGQVGLAMGPGVRREMRDYINLEKDRLKGFLDIGLPYCKGVCNAEQTELLLAAAEHIAADVSQWDFTLRFQSLGELLATFAQTEAARRDGAGIEPEDDPTWRKIVRIEGTLVSRDPAAGAQAKWINSVRAEQVGPPVHVQSSDGRQLLVYVDAHTESLMTAPLREGQRYVLIAREASLSLNADDTLSFELLSYDLTP